MRELKLPRPLGLTEEERRVLTPRRAPTVSEWALARRRLSEKTSERAGPWSHEYTPYLVEIMDSLSDMATRQVTVAKCSQAGGTEAGLNFIGWVIEESPGPLLIVMPTEADTNRRLATRVRPMFEATASLRRHLPYGRLDNLNVGKETELDNLILYLAWAGSPAALADNPICYVILDEVGKYPPAAGREADPVSLAKKRLRTFYFRSKLYCPSTPVIKDDLFDREFRRGDQRSWWARCPACGEYQVLTWSQVELDKTDSGELLAEEQYRAGGRARYRCCHCRAPWREQDRWRAVSEGRWAPAGCRVNRAGGVEGDARTAAATHRSYHINALMLYPGFVTVAELAAEWAAAQAARRAGDIKPLQDFVNSQLGEAWAEAARETDEARLKGHIGEYQEMTVPEGVQVLTAGIDVQEDHFWVRVLGWGYMSQVWSIYEDRLEAGDTADLANYQVLRHLLARRWAAAQDDQDQNGEDQGGRYWQIACAAIDCGYRTDVVVDFCRQVSETRLVPVRGDDTVRANLFRRVKTAGGQRDKLYRYDLNVNTLKERLHRLYSAERPGPGYFHLHRSTGYETLAQLTSEQQVLVREGRRTRLVWQVKGRRANHLFDCDVYASFAAELAGARLLPDPEAPPAASMRRVGRLAARR